MIVDTSALAAIALGEPNWEALTKAIIAWPGIVPAPVLVELRLALAKHGKSAVDAAFALVENEVMRGMVIAPFEERHAALVAPAFARFGKGNGRGGVLNFGDLMVYAVAKDRGEPVLCTGRDFSSTDLAIHPASRLDS